MEPRDARMALMEFPVEAPRAFRVDGVETALVQDVDRAVEGFLVALSALQRKRRTGLSKCCALLM
jgi:hypothetical protein